MIETAVVGSKRIEKILKNDFHAEGRGLHECLTSVQHRIPPDIMSQARYIASVRNKVVHEDGVIDDVSNFSNTVDNIVYRLNNVIRLEMELEREKARQKLKEQEEVTLHKPEDIESPRSVSKILFFSVTAVAFLSLIANFTSDRLICNARDLRPQITTSAHSQTQAQAQAQAQQVSKLRHDVQIRDEMLSDLRKQLGYFSQRNNELCNRLKLSNAKLGKNC